MVICAKFYAYIFLGYRKNAGGRDKISKYARYLTRHH